MLALFTQNSFARGLDTESDPTKAPINSYPLLINGRIQRNVIEPTRKHVELSAPSGNYQGLYSAGSIVVLFVSGNAYYADVTQSPINFIPILNWSQMDATTNRLYAEIVPATSNFFNRTGAPDSASNTFNNTIAAFREALFVWDGSTINRPRAVLPDGTVITLNDFAEWSKNDPEYVPFGLLPCFAANKLFLVSPDRKKVLHSVSGRASDFMVNITNSGEAGGNADTVAVTVSFNDITSLRSLSSGQVLASTLYGSWAINLDYANTIFGEPYLSPVFLFPAGAINELSSIPLASQDAEGGIFADTAFITQSGIHAFNAVAQALRESNNFALGAPIKGLLTDPTTGKPFIQANTCATNYEDLGLFAVNTLYGYGALVYDTDRRVWVSLDLSFGHVKQFANVKINGQERLFFITHENKVYEAFADEAVNTSRIYLGEWVPSDAAAQALLYMVNTVFLNVKNSGQLKLTLYADGAKHAEQILKVNVPGYTDNPPLPIPFTDKRKSTTLGWQLGDKALCWNAGIMLEWNFNGQLSEVALAGELVKAENPSMIQETTINSQTFALLGETGSEEINSGTDFVNGFHCQAVTEGNVYVYFANGNGRLVSGNIIVIENGIFTANNDRVAIEGPGIPTWSLRDITELTNVLRATRDRGIDLLIGGGNHSYHFGTSIDVETNAYPLRNNSFYPVAGVVDLGIDNGKYFYNHYRIPRYYSKAYDFIEFFFYNYDPNEPDGVDVNSKQWAWLNAKIQASTKQFKVVVLANPPYSTEEDLSPGYAPMQLPFATLGIMAVLSGVGKVMERRIVDGIPYLNCGVSGPSLGQFAFGTEGIDAFRENTKHGYLEIKTDPVTCLFTFRDTSNNALDEYAIYA